MSYSNITSKIPEYASDELIRKWTAIYYALITEVDEQIGLTISFNDSLALVKKKLRGN